MLLQLHSVLVFAQTWSEGCPCHTHLMTDSVPKKLRLLWNTCPFRGCRAPELAAGDFWRSLRQFMDQCTADLMVKLDPNLTEVERLSIVEDFNSGSQYIWCSLAVRLGFWAEPLYKIAGIAHKTVDVCRKIAADILQSESTHPLLVACRSPGALINQELRQFVFEFDDPNDLPCLQNLRAKLALMKVVERLNEGKHAKHHKRGQLSWSPVLLDPPPLSMVRRTAQPTQPPFCAHAILPHALFRFRSSRMPSCHMPSSCPRHVCTQSEVCECRMFNLPL